MYQHHRREEREVYAYVEISYPFYFSRFFFETPYEEKREAEVDTRISANKPTKRKEQVISIITFWYQIGESSIQFQEEIEVELSQKEETRRERQSDLAPISSFFKKKELPTVSFQDSIIFFKNRRRCEKYVEDKSVISCSTTDAASAVERLRRKDKYYRRPLRGDRSYTTVLRLR